MLPLPPALLQGVAVFIVGLSVLVVAAHTALLALAGGRTAQPFHFRLGPPLVVGGLLALWLGWAVSVSVSPDAALLVPSGQRPVLLAQVIGLIALGALPLFVSRRLRELNAAMPPSWLVAVQTYRLAGVMFLWPFLSHGVLPAGFALPAGIGDALTGFAAPFVAWALARNRRGAYGWAVGWNLIGILDLIIAPVAAVLTQASAINQHPLLLVPLFLGPPLGTLTHLYSLRNLHVHRVRANAAEPNRKAEAGSALPRLAQASRRSQTVARDAALAQ